MERVSCAICGTNNTIPVFTKWGLEVVRCRLCDLTYVNPRVITADSEDYLRGPYLTAMEENGILRPEIERSYSALLDHLESILNPGRLLDAGCAMGHFLAFAQQRRWTGFGVTPNESAAGYGKSKWGLRTQAAADLRDAQLPENHFDACVLLETVGRLSQPFATLSSAFRLLKRGGVLYITTPNFGSFAALQQREKWVQVIPTGNLYYFHFQSLRRLLASIGFEHVTNLSPAADFAVEIERAKELGTLAVNGELLEAMRREAYAEDVGKPCNGRGESLVVCARKPHSSHDAIVASLRLRKPVPPLQDKLVSTPQDSRVYLIHDGCKHWVTDATWLRRNGMRIEDTIQVEEEILRTFFTGEAI